MAIEGRIELVFNFSDLTRRATAEQKRILLELFSKNQKRIEGVLKGKFLEEIEASSTYQELKAENGVLRVEFGLATPSKTLFGITKTLIEKVKVNVKRASVENDNYILPIQFLILTLDLNGVLKSPDASYISVNSKGESTNVPWLDWLLTADGGVVVLGYQVMVGNFSNNRWSRTGQAIMRKAAGGVYSVSPQYSSVADDNFITRAAQKAAEALPDIITKEVINRG